MALHFCIKQIVWLRQLMEEIGLGAYVSQPTVVYADNRQANNLCREEVVTAGNMYFRTIMFQSQAQCGDHSCIPPQGWDCLF